MKKNKFSEQSRDLLSLADLHEELEEKKAKSKIMIVPVLMIIFGILLILSGIFYKDIESFLKKNFNKPTKTEKKDEKDPSLTTYECTSTSNDNTLGLTKKNVTTYNFKDNLLKNITITYTMKVMENASDIGTNNIKIYYQRYNDVAKTIVLEGLTINVTYKDDTLKNVVFADLEVLDPTKIPQNDYINISSQKDQTLRNIKEIEGKAGHICKTS